MSATDPGASAPRRGEFAYYVRRIADRVPFALSRWGDGEWSAILGRSGRNCDGHRYTKRLRRDLSAVLVAQPPYDLGLQAFAMRRFGRSINAWLAHRGLSPDWVDADVFARASIAGTLRPLMEALARREVVLIGPAHQIALSQFFPLARHIIVPDQNCHEDVERVVAETEDALRPFADAVLVVSASMSANVIVDRIYRNGGSRHTLIDCGALWEPYLGRATRSYHQAVLDRERVRS